MSAAGSQRVRHKTGSYPSVLDHSRQELSTAATRSRTDESEPPASCSMNRSACSSDSGVFHLSREYRARTALTGIVSSPIGEGYAGLRLFTSTAASIGGSAAGFRAIEAHLHASGRAREGHQSFVSRLGRKRPACTARHTVRGPERRVFSMQECRKSAKPLRSGRSCTHSALRCTLHPPRSRFVQFCRFPVGNELG
jgi:hypothetical protein